MTDQAITLTEGDEAPDFTLPTNGSGTVTLSGLRGQPVVVYFYPKDNTPGCTTEAIDFSAMKDDFAALNTTIIGISPDSAKKHDNFVAKHDLTILLASDEDTSVCEGYGIWGEKKMYGKTFMGVERSTFLVDANGKIAKIWRKVKVKGHASDVLDAVREL